MTTPQPETPGTNVTTNIPRPGQVTTPTPRRLPSLADRVVAQTPPHLADLVGQEVERREKLYAELAAACKYAGPPPRVAALQSVLEDLHAGRIR